MNSKGKGLGLFSKLSRKSLSDLSEWNKNDEKLMQHIERSELHEIISLLKKKKVCSTKLDPQGHSALHVAAMRNKYDVVQLLIAYSANVTAVDFQGRTALHCAARHGASEVLEVLSHSKEDDWPRDENNMTALHQACIGGSLDCVINLIRKYPKDIQAVDEDGRTPLFYAAQIGHLNVCKELLDRGANVNTQDKFGRTALMCAAENGNRLICELFVKKGADISLCDQMGHTASWHAMDAGHTTVKQTIEPCPEEDAAIDVQNNQVEFTDRHRLHSPIPEESESVFGEDDTLPIRFRSGGKAGSGEAGGSELDLVLSGAESDDEFKASTLSETDDDGSISPRLSELSYTMSHVKDEADLSHKADPAVEFKDSLIHENEETNREIETEPKKLVLVTDLDAEDGTVLYQVEQNLNRNTKRHLPTIDKSEVIRTTHLNSKPESKQLPSENMMPASAASTSNIPSNTDNNRLSNNRDTQTATKLTNVHSDGKKSLSATDQSNVDILMASEGISLSSVESDSSLSSESSDDSLSDSESESDDDTEVPVVSSLSETSKSDQTGDTELKKAHDTLLTNYDKLKQEYEKVCTEFTDLEKERKRRSQEDLEVTERMDMVVQLGELSAKLEDEQSRNKQLQAQITTLENLAVGVANRSQECAVGKETAGENGMQWIDDFGGEYEDDSDDEFGFPGVCLLNNSTGKQGKEEVKPVAKVSGRPRQMSLKEENREIAKLKTEIESIDRQKHSLAEALTQLQSRYEECEHSRRKLYSELDVCKSTLEVKSQENEGLAKENEELIKSSNKYKDRATAAVEQTKSYKREVDRLGRKLELYDKEYRKVKERLKRKDANEKRMLKDRQGYMKKMDESVRKMKESEKALDSLRESSHEEIDNLMVKCEELESEMAILKDFNEDQHYEIERLSELADCSEEMYDLKQLEIQSLEKQISLLKDVSMAPQRRDSMRDSQKTIQSLQDQVTKLQSQLAETAANYQETIEVYRNNLIMASKNLLDSDVKEAILHVIELRKP